MYLFISTPGHCSTFLHNGTASRTTWRFTAVTKPSLCLSVSLSLCLPGGGGERSVRERNIYSPHDNVQHRPLYWYIYLFIYMLIHWSYFLFGSWKVIYLFMHLFIYSFQCCVLPPPSHHPPPPSQMVSPSPSPSRVSTFPAALGRNGGVGKRDDAWEMTEMLF